MNLYTTSMVSGPFLPDCKAHIQLSAHPSQDLTCQQAYNLRTGLLPLVCSHGAELGVNGVHVSIAWLMQQSEHEQQTKVNAATRLQTSDGVSRSLPAHQACPACFIQDWQARPRIVESRLTRRRGHEPESLPVQLPWSRLPLSRAKLVLPLEVEAVPKLSRSHLLTR